MTVYFSGAWRKVRSGLGQMRLRRTPLDVPLFLFFLTLFVALWVSYSARLALDKFWMMLLSLAVYYLVTAVSRRHAWWVASFGGVMAAGLTLYFLTAGFWQRGLDAAGGLFSPFHWLLSLRLFFPLLLPHPNVIAGHIVMLFPYIIATLLYTRRERRTTWGVVSAVCLFIALVGLFVTRSVGAWLALVAGLGVWVLWPVSGRLLPWQPLPRRSLYALLLVITAVCGVALVWLVISQGLPGGQTLAERLALAGSGRQLAQDYSWLGSGLASFPALYAEYVQVVPNFYLIYSNFYLDTLLELGPVGAVCLLAIWAGAGWLVLQALRRSLARPYPHMEDVYWLRWATLCSLIIILVHGVVDDVLFGGLGTPLLFFTPAMAVLVSRRQGTAKRLFLNKRTAWVTAVILLILGGILAAFHQHTLADWYAFQGAQAMDRVLFVGWPGNQWHDGRDLTTLSAARYYFEKALALDNHNRTAHQRLGMITLWEQDLDTAVDHLREAYQADSSHRGVIKTLGYAYVWQGELEQALPLLTQIPESRIEMQTYTDYWYNLNQPLLAEQAAAMAVLLGNEP